MWIEVKALALTTILRFLALTACFAFAVMLVIALTADPLPANVHTSSLVSGILLLATTILILAYLIVGVS